MSVFIRLLSLILFLSISNQNSYAKKPYVILISIDGFRHDYTENNKLKYLTKVKANGSYAKSLLPVFPSKTFPNHLSIITGLYPENHGIIANFFYNNNTYDFYAINDEKSKTNSSWYQGEPIWIDLEKYSIKTASYFWPGSDVFFSKKKPSYYFPYKHNVSNKNRTQQIIDWLKLPQNKRPHFLSLYFSTVDSAGHHYGPNSKEVLHASIEIDHLLKKMEDEIVKLKIKPNIIIVSDHGMTEIKKKNIIYLSDYCTTNEISHIVGSGSYYNLYFKDKKRIKTIYNKLKKIKKLSIYHKDKLPIDLHINHKKHIGDLIISVKHPYYMQKDRTIKHFPKGEHGYNPKETEDMHGVFYAKGPNIKSNVHLDSFENIHIKAFILKIFGIFNNE